VVDGATGAEVPAAEAFYVRSVVVADAVTRDRVHAFARREDAERHAEAHHGTLLVGAERPFPPAAGVR
jgi:hypothetical protein